MLIPYTNAAHYIGNVNPGVGYWWTQTNGVWCLVVPARQAVNVFWPMFILSLMIVGIPVFMIRRLTVESLRGSAASDASRQSNRS